MAGSVNSYARNTGGFTDGQVGAVTVTVDQDNGAGGSDVRSYKSDDLGVTWTEISSETTAAMSWNKAVWVKETSRRPTTVRPEDSP